MGAGVEVRHVVWGRIGGTGRDAFGALWESKRGLEYPSHQSVSPPSRQQQMRDRACALN